MAGGSIGLYRSSRLGRLEGLQITYGVSFMKLVECQTWPGTPNIHEYTGVDELQGSYNLGGLFPFSRGGVQREPCRSLPAPSRNLCRLKLLKLFEQLHNYFNSRNACAFFFVGSGAVFLALWKFESI